MCAQTCDSVPAACPHMIATACASFVGTLASVDMLSLLVLVNLGPCVLSKILVTDNSYIEDEFNSNEEIRSFQTSKLFPFRIQVLSVCQTCGDRCDQLLNWLAWAKLPYLDDVRADRGSVLRDVF